MKISVPSYVRCIVGAQGIDKAGKPAVIYVGSTYLVLQKETLPNKYANTQNSGFTLVTEYTLMSPEGQIINVAWWTREIEVDDTSFLCRFEVIA